MGPKNADIKFAYTGFTFMVNKKTVVARRTASKDAGFLCVIVTTVCRVCQSIISCRECRSILDMLVAPIQERMDDWKKVAVQLDKEHGKGTANDTCRKSHRFFHAPRCLALPLYLNSNSNLFADIKEQ